MTEEDWIAWNNQLALELIRQSPSTAIRHCFQLAALYLPLARELFNAAFVSCYNNLKVRGFEPKSPGGAGGGLWSGGSGNTNTWPQQPKGDDLFEEWVLNTLGVGERSCPIPIPSQASPISHDARTISGYVCQGVSLWLSSILFSLGMV